MNSIFIYSMLFLWGLKTYCCENQPILHLPFQQTMSITPYPVPQYHVPEKTLPIVEHAVLHRIDQAIIELHKENFIKNSSTYCTQYYSKKNNWSSIFIT